jgi:hypothetical protein
LPPPRISQPSRRVSRADALRDLGSMLTLDDGNVILALKIKPELCTVSKIATEANRCIGGNRAATIENAGNAA